MGRGRCGPPTPGAWPAAQPVSSAAILGPVFPPLSPLLPPGQQLLENLNAGLTSLAAPACPLGLPDSQWPALRGRDPRPLSSAVRPPPLQGAVGRPLDSDPHPGRWPQFPTALPSSSTGPTHALQ